MFFFKYRSDLWELPKQPFTKKKLPHLSMPILWMKNVFFVYLKKWVLWFSKKLWCLYFFIFISSAKKKSHDEPWNLLESDFFIHVTCYPTSTHNNFSKIQVLSSHKQFKGLSCSAKAQLCSCHGFLTSLIKTKGFEKTQVWN